NLIIRQGQTGQSIGKSQQNIKLIADVTHQPVGAGMAFVRYLLGGLINIACYIDFLWPLWDQDKKRLSDKVLNFSVVQA
ncbi:MAG: RDD family protein, partial [Acidimicrobiia bacterium]|nr:RDD family protein [Acidimicrobiia bacterium]